MAADLRLPGWVRARVFLGGLVAGTAGGALGAVWGIAEGLGQRFQELSAANLQSGLIMGSAFGVLPGLIVGALSLERLDRTGRTRILWTSPIHAFAAAFLPSWPLLWSLAASSAAC